MFSLSFYWTLLGNSYCNINICILLKSSLTIALSRQPSQPLYLFFIMSIFGFNLFNSLVSLSARFYTKLAINLAQLINCNFRMSFLFLSILLTSFVFGTEKALYFPVFSLKKLNSPTNSFTNYFMTIIVQPIVKNHNNFFRYTRFQITRYVKQPVFTSIMTMVNDSTMTIIFIISVFSFKLFCRCSKILYFHAIPAVQLFMVSFYFQSQLSS